ncbi:hypothetical protein ACIO13_23150 [Streptomyces sp. NPDC087425]
MRLDARAVPDDAEVRVGGMGRYWVAVAVCSGRSVWGRRVPEAR